MTPAVESHTTTDRLVFAPKGAVWVEGDDRYPGEWQRAELAAGEVDQANVRRPVPDGDAGWDVLPMPADEPASKADLIALAAKVYEQERQRLSAALGMAPRGARLPLRGRRVVATRNHEDGPGLTPGADLLGSQ